MIKEVLVKYKELNRIFDFTCCLYACAPFVTDRKLADSFKILQKNDFDSVFPIMTFGFPIQRALKMGRGNRINFLYPEFSLTRSQDLAQN